MTAGARAGALLLAALAAAACSGPRQRFLDVATTTSVQNSGLLEMLLPHFTGATVRVHAAGSGRSLEMMADGIVDVVITHAPQTEARLLTAHPGWLYRKLAHNRFVIVGPPGDPARVAGALDAIDAFRRIAGAPVTFVSRGDASGTHEREQALWQEAGVTPDAARLIVSGRGMALTLRHAQERQGYTLADEATYRQLEHQLDLVVLSAGDPRLLNTYAVVHPPAHQLAEAFTEWLTRGDGRARIAAYQIEGRPAFTIWPAGCPDERPDLLPCA
jgi:tungstate transport system substrate-binding protein